MCDATARSNATILGSRVAQSHEAGVFVMGSDVRLEGMVVSDSQPDKGSDGIGIGIHTQIMCQGMPLQCDPTARANIEIHASMVEQSYDFGVVAVDSDMLMTGTLVRDTKGRIVDKFMGDGVSVLASIGSANGTLRSTRIATSARAGVSSFGGFVSLAGVAIECAAFAINGEQGAGMAYSFADEGANGCGCPGPSETCKAVSAGLTPPSPLLPTE
jgi:hypothetical protein